MSVTMNWNPDDHETGKEWLETLETVLRIAGEEEGITEGEVSLTFVNNEEIREMNRQYRGIDRATDVLSFPMWESAGEEPEIYFGDEFEDPDEEEDAAEGEEFLGLDELDESDDDLDEAEELEELSEETGEELPELIGDIVISLERAEEQSREYGHSLKREIAFLFVHGFLHLIGYDHEAEAEEKEMFEKQELILQKAGIPR